MWIWKRDEIVKCFSDVGTGHKVQWGGGGGGRVGSDFQWPTPALFDKIGAAHPWSGTEKPSDPPLN